MDQKDSIVQDVLHINSWQALHSTLALGRTGSLSVTINMYRTTSKALVNGRDSTAMASSINALLNDINSHPEVKAGNDYYKTALDPAKLKSKQKTQKQQKSSRTVSAPNSPLSVRTHNSVALHNTNDHRKTPKPQNSVRTFQDTPKIQLKNDQIKENSNKSNDFDLKTIKVPQKLQTSITTPQKTPKLQPKRNHVKENIQKSSDSSLKKEVSQVAQSSMPIIQSMLKLQSERDQIKESGEKINNSNLKKKVSQIEKQATGAQHQITGGRNDNLENRVTNELAALHTDSTLHGDADGSNCPVCSESVGVEGLVCKICNECFHAACEKVEVENNPAEYVCRTCETVGEIDYLHATPGRAPASQPNGNNGTPEAGSLPSKLPIATHRQNQTKSLCIVPYQSDQATTFLLRSPAPTLPFQQKAIACTPKTKKITSPRQKQNCSQSPPYNHAVSQGSYDQLYSKYNQLKEELDTLKSQQNTAQRKIQAKEKQIKKREAELIQNEAQQREIYEHNRLLKDYSHTLELKINDLEEQNKQLKLNLLTSESLRTNPTRERQQLPVNESEQKEESKQNSTPHVNETIMALLTTSMATLSSSIVALQNQINQGSQNQKPHIKITNVYSRENNHKRTERNENTNHYGQKKKNSSLNSEPYEARQPTNEANPILEKDKQRIEQSINEDWRRKEQKSFEPQQEEAKYNESWRQATRSDVGSWRRKQQSDKDRQQAERRSDEQWWRRDTRKTPSQSQETRSNVNPWRQKQRADGDWQQAERKPDEQRWQRDECVTPSKSLNSPELNENGQQETRKENDPQSNTPNEQANESIYELASEDFLELSRKPKTPDKSPWRSPSPTTN